MRGARVAFGGTTALAAAVVVAALAADAARPAAAQGRFEAEYTATLAGIPIGRGNWVIEISDDQFTATATGGTFGIMRVLNGGHGTSTAQGPLSSGAPTPQSYASTITNDKRVDDVRMAFAGGNVKELSVEPPLGPSPDRIPVTDADRHNVLDPMTATLVHVAGNGDPVSPQACGRKAAVFDGRMRFDLRSEFKRIETVKAEKGYQGPVVVCAVYFTPISGYNPDRYAIRYLPACATPKFGLRRSSARASGALSVLAADAGRQRRSAGDAIRSVPKPPRAAAVTKTQ